MNSSWLLFYGHQLNMTRQETLNTTFGEFMDLISCLAIYNGADPAPEKRELSLEEIFEMR